MHKRMIAGLVCCFLSQPVCALNILDVYALTQKNDPEFLATFAEKMAGEEQRQMSRAGLLPSVSLSWQNGMKSWQRAQSMQSKGVFSKEMQRVTTHNQYQSQSGSLMLTQPLFDYEAWSRYQLGIAQSAMSDAVWRAKFMDLSVRTVNRYLDVLAAQDRLTLVSEQHASYQQLLEQNRKMLRAGEGTITEVIETQSRLSLAQAEQIAAEEELETARRELSGLIGLPAETLPKLDSLAAGKLKPVSLSPARFSEWQKIALSQNAELAAARQQLQVRYRQQEQQRASFMPRIQFYASHGLNKSASDTTINQKYQTSTVGVQLNYSLYAGGYNSAALRQASSYYNQSKYELEKATRETMNNLHRNFQQCHSAERRLTAYQQAVDAAALQVEVTEKGIRAGQRTNADLINAKKDLYQARLNASAEKYNYIRAWLMLLYYSGQLTPEKLTHIATFFSPS